MFTTAEGIPPEAHTYLEALEVELARPIRVLRSTGRTIDGTARWTADQRRACGNATASDARNNGITIYPYGSLHSGFGMLRTQLPPTLMSAHMAAAYPEGYRIYDVIQPPADPLFAEVYYRGDLAWGEIGDRVLALYSNWFGWQDWLGGDYSWLREMVVASFDEAQRAVFREAMNNRERTALAAYVQRVSQAGVTELRDLITSRQGLLSANVSTVARLKHELRDYQRRLDAMTSTADYADLIPIAEMHFDRLKEDPRLEGVTFTDGNLIIDTVGVDITHPITGVSAYLGKFRWTIPLQQNEIMVENLDNARGGFDHPHVHNHSPCFGDMGDTVYTMLRNGLFAEVVEMVFVFLESVNIQDDWGRHASYWLTEVEDTAEVVA